MRLVWLDRPVRFTIYNKEEARNSRIFLATVMAATFGFAAFEVHGTWPNTLTTVAGYSISWGAAVAAVIVLVGAFVTFVVMNTPKVVDFCSDVESELRKVSWPAARQVVNATLVVLVTITLMFCGIIIWDYVITRALSLLGLYPRGSG